MDDTNKLSEEAERELFWQRFPGWRKMDGSCEPMFAAWLAAKASTPSAQPSDEALLNELATFFNLNLADVQEVARNYWKQSGAVIWFCESHPEHPMGHAGCAGAGVLEEACVPLLVNQIRLLKQEVRETAAFRDDAIRALEKRLAAQPPRALPGEASDAIETLRFLLRESANMLEAKERERSLPKRERYIGNSSIYVANLVTRARAALATTDGLSAMCAEPAAAGEPLCACKHRPTSQCDEQWGPNCDLGNNAAHARRAPEGSGSAVDAALGINRGASAEGASEGLAAMEARKDAAYLERNQVVSALAKCFPSGVARTAIEGWSEDWHGCVYIDLPTGQASWHFHDSHAYLFEGLPVYAGQWDGHDTPEKYRRLAALRAGQGDGEAR